MDVSNRDEKNGPKLSEDADLLGQVVALTGIPAELMQSELDKILGFSGQNSKELTLEDLRAAMIRYLESMQEDFQKPAIVD